MDTQNTHILIIEDDRTVCKSLELLMRKHKFACKSIHHPSEAIETIESFQPSLIIMDMNFTIDTSGRQGLKLLDQIRLHSPDIHIILVTGWATLQLAVEGMKRGAKDFIAKPWDNKHLIRSVKDLLWLDEGNPSSAMDHRNQKIIGSSDKLMEVLDMAGKVASTAASVLISGESGTGKELLAEFIHHNSDRKDKPFIKVNLGGISQSLFESEMFGHIKGAFTDAINDRIGRFEMADGGTIFLDEIGELSLSNQVKLLRVLQERTFEKLGSSRSKKVDFRVISATNKDLASMVNLGGFREDLYYRINLIQLHLPPLVERRTDIQELANFYAHNIRKLYDLESLYITDEALEWLGRQSYPGNIRQLKNLVERTILLSSDKREITVKDFQSMGTGAEAHKDVSVPEVGTISLDRMEEEMVKKALNFHNFNISKSAASLGLTRSALYRRMKKYNINYDAES